MNPTVELVAVTILAPVACAVGAVWLSRKFLSGGSAAFAFAVSFWLGYALLAWLHSRSDFAPTRHWQWIPYLTIKAAAVGAVIGAVKMPAFARWMLIADTAIVSAWLLVPTWPDLEPRREWAIALLALYFFVLAVLLELPADRFSSQVVAGQMALAAACTAALIAALVSLTYGEAAIIAAASLGGCAIGAWLFPAPALIRALTLVYAINVGGWAFTGAINPRPSMFVLLVPPLAPLALRICAIGPLARKRGLAAVAIQTAAVLVVLVIAGSIAWFTTDSPGESDW